MRGSIFYDKSRQSAVETSREFLRHREKLNLINNRQYSTMRKFEFLFTQTSLQ